MSPSLRRGLLLAAAALSALTSSDAFGVQSGGGHGRVRTAPPAPRDYGPVPPASAAAAAAAASSALFRGGGRRRRRAAALTPLRAADADSDQGEKPAEVAEPAAASSSSSASEDVATPSEAVVAGEPEKGEGSGLVAALLLGPPLFAKFVIVLVVKFLTDLVVFPLLFLYRMARMGKNKVLGLLGKEATPGDKVNGES